MVATNYFNDNILKEPNNFEKLLCYNITSSKTIDILYLKLSTTPILLFSFFDSGIISHRVEVNIHITQQFLELVRWEENVCSESLYRKDFPHYYYFWFFFRIKFLFAYNLYIWNTYFIENFNDHNICNVLYCMYVPSLEVNFLCEQLESEPQ